MSAKFAESLREGGFGYSVFFFERERKEELGMQVEIKIVLANKSRK